MANEKAPISSFDGAEVTIEVRSASKTYPARNPRQRVDPALQPLSIAFSSAAPKVVAVVGQSGSGKSTLASLILGFEEATTGEVCFQGVSIQKLGENDRRRFRHNVQAVFQDPYASFNPFYKVRRTIEFSLRRLAGVRDKTRIQELAADACRRVGLDPDVVLTRFPHQLSGGQRQRLMVARALSLRPAFLVADEPVSMVDASLRASILDNLDALHRTVGASVLYITHDLTTAGRISDSIIVLEKGQVVEAGAAKEVLAHPAHPYTRLLVDSVPSPSAPTGWANYSPETHHVPSGSENQEARGHLIALGPSHAVAGDAGIDGPTIELQSVL